MEGCLDMKGCLARGLSVQGVCAHGCLIGGVSAQGVVCPGGVCPGVCVPRGVCLGSVCPWGCLPGGVSVMLNRMMDRCKNITLPQLYEGNNPHLE